MLTYFSAGFSLSSYACTYMSACFPRDRLLGHPAKRCWVKLCDWPSCAGLGFTPPPRCPLQEVWGPGLTLLSPGGCGQPWEGGTQKPAHGVGGPHPTAECESAPQCPSCPTESDPLTLSLNTHDSAVNKAVPSTGQMKTQRPRGAAGMDTYHPSVHPFFLQEACWTTDIPCAPCSRAVWSCLEVLRAFVTL